jgi:hypothetical protein
LDNFDEIAGFQTEILADVFGNDHLPTLAEPADGHGCASPGFLVVGFYHIDRLSD